MEVQTMTTPTQAKPTQVYQVFINAPAQRIWDAITKPEFTRRYFHGTSVESDFKAGSPYRSYLSGDRGLAVEGDVLESHPPRRLVHTWVARYDPELAAEQPSRVTWEIDERGGGMCLLTVVHDQLEDAPKTAQSVSGEGWMYVLSGLKTLLETGEPLPALEQ